MSEAAYQNLAQLAAAICDTPFAVIALINNRRQYIRAVMGLEEQYHDPLLSLCTYAARYRSTLIVENTRAHPWLNSHSLVMHDPAIRSLASIPFHIYSENSSGVVCVFDRCPHALSNQQITNLSAIASEAGHIHHLSRRESRSLRHEINIENIKKQERLRIARELHDDLGQHLLLLKIELMLMKKTNNKKMNEQINAAIGRIEKSVLSARKIIRNLRSSEVESGLLFSIKNYIQELENTTNINYTVEISNFFSKEKIPENIQLILFRILQEALSNIIRHANASTVSLRLWRDFSGIKMKIMDDGIGMPIKTAQPVSQSFGLTGMRERLHTANGRLIIQSSPGGGTALLISIPFQESESLRTKC